MSFRIEIYQNQCICLKCETRKLLIQRKRIQLDPITAASAVASRGVTGSLDLLLPQRGPSLLIQTVLKFFVYHF